MMYVVRMPPSGGKSLYMILFTLSLPARTDYCYCYKFSCLSNESSFNEQVHYVRRSFDWVFCHVMVACYRLRFGERNLCLSLH